ncbi:ornithine cyclodeaminase family protein [Aestuariivita boseongensis]|uniref:ornithine cyclodeaminase family protein n=1 Tax=Aestuariivita boseongensis TaxID=1470562 RepID=UPI00067FE4F0|nr:NAD(P)-binding domain-containing protein [Aestuariivita boseongensis]
MTIPSISFAEGEALMDWTDLTKAFEAGHALPKAEVGDTFLYRGDDTVLSRAAWIDGMGMAVKTATIFPGNPAQNLPIVNGGVCLYSDGDGTLEALIDFHLITKWKTAGDSLLGALRLAPEGASKILIVGAGTVGASLIEAFTAGFPGAQITLWNRTAASAEALAAQYPGTLVAADLEQAVGAADIILTATMSSEPLIRGDWLRPGQHLNLIGAYRPDMRETDDTAMTRARIYVDSFDTTIGHIGEIEKPLQAGVITRDDIRADFYALSDFRRGGPDEITVFKNGGGAHLDLMTSRYVLDRWRAAQ